MNIYQKKIMGYIGLKLKKILFFPIDTVKYCLNGIRLNKSIVRKDFPIKGILPFLSDKYDSAGTIDRHYFLQDIYVARKVIADDPKEHFDIGSRLDGFLAHLICNKIPVTMIDIRPLTISVEGLKFKQNDATNLKGFNSASIKSLSSLHAVEHFGLGRYGDPIGANDCFSAMKAMQRVLKVGGTLYFSVPISNRNGIIYNSHRVFNPRTVLETFNEMYLDEFAFIQNYRIFTYKGKEAKHLIQNNLLNFEDYDCGIFILKK